MLPKALKTFPKSNKLPNLVTLVTRDKAMLILGVLDVDTRTLERQANTIKCKQLFLSFQVSPVAFVSI